jgi:clathrin heavy chain
MAIPISTTEVLTFQQLGVDPQFASLSNSALSQDKWLCVREVTEAEANVVIVDLQGGNNVTRHKMKADAAVMHPTANIIALRGASALQVFDLNQRARLKSHQLPEGQLVQYWRWLDENTLAFVAGGGVFHWALEPPRSAPVPVFQLQPQLVSGDILHYSVSHDQQWLAVSALIRENE